MLHVAPTHFRLQAQRERDCADLHQVGYSSLNTCYQFNHVLQYMLGHNEFLN